MGTCGAAARIRKTPYVVLNLMGHHMQYFTISKQWIKFMIHTEFRHGAPRNSAEERRGTLREWVKFLRIEEQTYCSYEHFFWTTVHSLGADRHSKISS